MQHYNKYNTRDAFFKGVLHVCAGHVYTWIIYYCRYRNNRDNIIMISNYDDIFFYCYRRNGREPRQIP